MGNTEKVKLALIKYGLIFFLWIILTIFQKANAQNNHQELHEFKYTGIEVSFGVSNHPLKVNSEIKSL